MTKPIPPYLKLHTQEACEAPPAADLDGLTALCDAFSEATGWPLRFVPGIDSSHDVDLMWSAPVNPGVGTSPGHFSLDLGGSSADDEARSDRAAAQKLAAAVADLWGQLAQARDALWRREADLAAGVPVIPHQEENEQLAERLRTTLQAGAEAVDCHAAALYLLDDGTSELKLRSAWGLPFSSLLKPARPLRGALADLEALLGHAVVLEDAALFESWKAPDEMAAAAAMCVPVSTPTMPLGTLWLFSREPRTFSDRQTNMVEVVAGRLASDLERAVLLTEGAAAARERRDLRLASDFQHESSPLSPVALDGWDMAGLSRQACEVGGAFHDWFMLPDGRLAMAVGRARRSGFDAALAGAALRASLRTLADENLAPAQVVARVNETLWSTSAGDQFAQLAYLVVDPASGGVRIVTAGRMCGAVLREGAWMPIVAPTRDLGVDIETQFIERQFNILPGDRLLLSTATYSDCDEPAPWNDDELAAHLSDHTGAPARRWSDMIGESMWAEELLGGDHDLSLLVVKRLDR